MNKLTISGLSAMTLLALASCTQPPAVTQAEVSAGTTLAMTLADAIAPGNLTVQQALAKGALICGQIDSGTGELVAGTAEAVLNMAGVPVSVTGQAAAVVAGACPAFMQPVPAPVGTVNLPGVPVLGAMLLPAVQ